MPPRSGLTRADVVQIVNAIVDRLHNLPLGLGGLRRIGTDASSAAPGSLGANDFLVKTSSSTLSAERVVTDTSSITWDWSTPGQAKANASAAGLSVLTTKGDLWGFSTVNARVPVGSNGQVLTADSTNARGVSWQTVGGVTGPGSSVDSAVAVFDGTSGGALKQATTTGLAKLASGVLSAATAGTDYYAPGSTDVAIADGGTGASTAAGARANLGASTTRASSGLLELDSAGWFGMDAALASWRYSTSVAHFANNTTSGYGFTVSQAGTGATPSTLAYSRREATLNSGWFVSPRLASLTIGFAFALIFKLPSSITSRRLWIGLGSTTMNDSDTAAGSFVGVRYSTVAGDAGFMPASRNGTTQTIGTAGSAPVADVPYMMTIQAATGGSSVAVKITRLDTGATVLDVTISATLPASGTAIDWLLYNHGQGTWRAVEIAQAVRLMGLT